MTFYGLDERQRSLLQYEVISNIARSKLTRLVRNSTINDDPNVQLFRMNRFINIAHTILHKRIYVLKPDDIGEYHLTEYAWHQGQIELILKIPNTIELIDMLADMLGYGLLEIDEVNHILEEDRSSVNFTSAPFENFVIINIIPIEQIEEVENSNEHPNIRKLIERMNISFENRDYSNVLHSSSSILETLAKDVVNLPSVQDQTLGSFFEAYRNRSALPTPILDYIHDIYRSRGSEPLAAHGSTQDSSIDRDQAALLVEMTKAFVRLERVLTSNIR